MVESNFDICRHIFTRLMEARTRLGFVLLYQSSFSLQSQFGDIRGSESVP